MNTLCRLWFWPFNQWSWRPVFLFPLCRCCWEGRWRTGWDSLSVTGIPSVELVMDPTLTHVMFYTHKQKACTCQFSHSLHNTYVVPSTCKVLTRLGSPPSRDRGMREPPWRQPGRGSMLLLSSSPNWAWVQLHLASQHLFLLDLSYCHSQCIINAWLYWIRACFRMRSHAVISLWFLLYC